MKKWILGLTAAMTLTSLGFPARAKSRPSGKEPDAGKKAKKESKKPSEMKEGSEKKKD